MYIIQQTCINTNNYKKEYPNQVEIIDWDTKICIKYYSCSASDSCKICNALSNTVVSSNITRPPSGPGSK